MSPSAEALFSGLTLVLYFVSSVAHHAHLFAGSEKARRIATWMAVAGLAAHTVALGIWCTTHQLSILRDPGMPYSLVAYVVVVAQLFVDFRQAWVTLGSLSMPCAFVAQFASGVLAADSELHRPAGSALLSPHVIAILLGFAAFTLAFCLAVIYLVESRLLKTKRIRGLFSRLPPLESVGTGAHWLATLGFSMLTLGMITGAIAAPERWGPGWYLDPRTITSIVAWIIYAGYLGSRMLMGWRGRRTTYFLIAGYLVVLVALLASVGRPKAPDPARASAFSAQKSC